MAGKQQPWLMSYKYQPVFARGDDGGSSRPSPVEAVQVIDCAPWKYAAQHALDANAARKAPYPKDGTRLPDEILAIYWAVQLPMGALTDAELDILS